MSIWVRVGGLGTFGVVFWFRGTRWGVCGWDGLVFHLDDLFRPRLTQGGGLGRRWCSGRGLVGIAGRHDRGHDGGGIGGILLFGNSASGRFPIAVICDGMDRVCRVSQSSAGSRLVGGGFWGVQDGVLGGHA